MYNTLLLHDTYQVGYGHWNQIPVSRGFTTYTGNLDIDIDSYTKQMHLTPYDHGSIDWMSANVNGSYSHFAEARHPTEALTFEAQAIMCRHAAEEGVKSGKDTQPLFLYVAYPAPHSPCQPIERHTTVCQHIPHKWRRDFCGMMVGVGKYVDLLDIFYNKHVLTHILYMHTYTCTNICIYIYAVLMQHCSCVLDMIDTGMCIVDEGIANLTETIRTTLGTDTVMIVSSDNGGSPWNGGMNEPLRGGKFSAWEGGVRVPGFVVDFSDDKRYFGAGGRVYEGLVHISDWFPTLLGLAGTNKY